MSHVTSSGAYVVPSYVLLSFWSLLYIMLSSNNRAITRYDDRYRSEDGYRYRIRTLSCFAACAVPHGNHACVACNHPYR